jgi:hypothetical protein
MSGILNVDSIANNAGTGAPNFPFGLTKAANYAVGTAQTLASSVTGASYANLTHRITVSFTPIATGSFLAYAYVPSTGPGGSGLHLIVAPTSGSPGTVFVQDTIIVNGSTTLYVFGLFTLTGGVPYTFDIQGKMDSGGTGTISADAVFGGVALVIQQI